MAQLEESLQRKTLALVNDILGDNTKVSAASSSKNYHLTKDYYDNTFFLHVHVKGAAEARYFTISPRGVVISSPVMDESCPVQLTRGAHDKSRAFATLDEMKNLPILVKTPALLSNQERADQIVELLGDNKGVESKGDDGEYILERSCESYDETKTFYLLSASVRVANRQQRHSFKLKVGDGSTVEKGHVIEASYGGPHRVDVVLEKMRQLGVSARLTGSDASLPAVK